MKRLLSIPDHIVTFALVPLGYPAETKPRDGRFIPDRVHLG
jgi:hypothetical protein